jgi:hypothetical protein
MSQDIVFSIKCIFDNLSNDGVLKRYDADRFYIAPYQRGYKWASNDMNAPVCILMNDLFNAKENELKEYYLQYITTKSAKYNAIDVLEVIDGQQRLTTLTILLSILGLKNGHPAISNNRLSYEVRQKVSAYFDKYIYQNIGTILEKTWDEFITESTDNNEQDIYYLFHAANKINDMIDEKCKNVSSLTKEFEEFVLENVKIILNNIEGNVNCEEIFSNLNSNKVDLTEDELIKGLLLTNSARERENSERRISYREITEVRAIIGRQWDEIAHWINNEEIRAFFFSKTTPTSSLNELLLLLALYDEYKLEAHSRGKNEIFYHFDLQIKNKTKKASEYFRKYKELRNILNEWFTDDEIYNCIGYLFFSKNSKYTTIKNFLSLLKCNKENMKKQLRAYIIDMLNLEIDELDYEKNSREISNLLLAINVFCYNGRFNFSTFSKQKWSLEHIFPQNPKEFAGNLGINDIMLINSLIDNNQNSWENIEPHLQEFEDKKYIQTVYSNLKEKLEKKDACSITEDECLVLYKLIKTDKLHSIGNMVLLTPGQNSSNSNGMFDYKRINISKMVKTGDFVPRHTYDVFSKLISANMTADLKVWNETDINEHAEYIKAKFNFIKDTNK